MTKPSTSRKTVAVLIDYMNLFAGGFETECRRQFERTAREHDLNLMFVYGRALQHPDSGFAAHNRIYELLSANCISGVIALSSSIASFCGLGGAQKLFRNYGSIARCSVGLAIPSVPSIEVDNHSGMSDLLEHLIAQHSFRRIAFIRGPIHNVEADIRFTAYRQALGKHGITFDERLVFEGDFGRRAGNSAVEAMLASSKLLPDAIVAANDGMALGAISQLRKRGIRVPREIAITGFDDLVMARLGDPPLTTVTQPLDRMVEGAMRLITAQLDKREVSELTSLPARFVVRESCGCENPNHISATPSVGNIGTGSRELIVALAREKSQGASDTADPRKRDPSARLLDALAREFAGAPEALILELKLILSDMEESEEFQILQSLIGQWRHQFASVAIPELNDLWFRASTVIALTNTRRQEQLRLDHDQAYYRWIDVGERFGAALDLSTLAPALTDALLTLGIEHAYVSRYANTDQNELECFVAIRDARHYDPPIRRFPADHLAPTNAIHTSRRATFLAFPLTFNATNLGVAVFELRAEIAGYPIVRDQISAVMQSTALHQEIVRQTTENERRAQEQERQATAQRIQALSVLAGGVAHDLNNVLGPLVTLPDLMATELRRLALPAELAETHLASDLETIKTAALKATQTIKDLLTLGRQGHSTKEPLDLNQVISRHFAHETQNSSQFNARVTFALCDKSLHIVGSETHIGRAITNLIRNATDAIDEDGEVRVETKAVTLLEPLPGYETIESGRYAVVTVSDTGQGISPSDIGRLFEPFYSSKRLSDHSGSGLGLAIVHGVVKDHGGFINVESTVGNGTTFTVYLPRGEAIEATRTVTSAPPRGQARILVVDDEPLQLRACRRVLSHLGYRVDTLSSGREAMDLFSSQGPTIENSPNSSPQSPYDLVILDMLLDREEDGLSLFDRIRALYPQQRGIIASGHAPSQMVERASQRGLAWLAKPYTQNKLAQAVHTALTRVIDPTALGHRQSS